ncbi:hypothetical protein SSS_09782 [Sarcoptes scabiei]|nr:hypothetical protein SSS_09782 [Sarcoptes scabiei]
MKRISLSNIDVIYAIFIIVEKKSHGIFCPIIIKSNFSPLIQIEPIEQRRMEMDRFLMEYDKRNDRGNLVRKTFTKGMIQKSQARQFDYRLNLEYIKNLYPSEGRRLYHLLSVNAQPKLLVPMKKGFAIDLKTEEDFEDGKNLLQRINESLLEFTDTFEENKF